MANHEQLIFDVVVKDFSGRSYMIAVYPGLTVAQLKQEIARQSGNPANTFKIVFAGTKLKDEQTLAVSTPQPFCLCDPITYRLGLRYDQYQHFALCERTPQ